MGGGSGAEELEIALREDEVGFLRSHLRRRWAPGVVGSAEEMRGSFVCASG